VEFQLYRCTILYFTAVSKPSLAAVLATEQTRDDETMLVCC